MLSQKRVAALDLGTNTFHILIVEKSGDNFVEIHKERKWVSLAEDGISRFSVKVLDRAREALSHFRNILDKYKVSAVTVTGTEAFRSADNGKDFIQEVKEKYSLDIEIISGKREAELIYKGISIILPGDKGNNLIMDIGGGSTEFILYNAEGLIWSASFKAGVTFLYNMYIKNDPLTQADHNRLNDYFEQTLTGFPYKLLQKQPFNLVGASGSFEILESMFGVISSGDKESRFSIAQFMHIYNVIIPTSLEERLAHPDIPNSRAKLIVVAFILINYIIEKCCPKGIIVSPYALKEGIIREMLKL